MSGVMVWVKYIICSIIGLAIHWMGGLDALLKCLCVLIMIDWITGVLQAIYNKTLSSNIGYRGVAKKVVILLVVVLAYVIEMVTNSAFALREIVIMMFIANEGISILENAAKCGVEMPEKLVAILQQLKGNADNGSKD